MPIQWVSSLKSKIAAEGALSPPQKTFLTNLIDATEGSNVGDIVYLRNLVHSLRFDCGTDSAPGVLAFLDSIDGAYVQATEGYSNQTGGETLTSDELLTLLDKLVRMVSIRDDRCRLDLT